MHGCQESSCWRFVSFFELESTKSKSHIHVYMHSQSIPEGSPSFMAADFSKLDLPKLTADAAKYPKAGVPIERMEFWRNLESSLHELHQMPDGDGWLSLVHGLEAKKITPAEDPAPPAISQQIMDACVKDRQPIPEVCRVTRPH